MTAIQKVSRDEYLLQAGSSWVWFQTRLSLLFPKFPLPSVSLASALSSRFAFNYPDSCPRFLRLKFLVMISV